MESEPRTVDVLGSVRIGGIAAHGETAAALLVTLALAGGAPRSVDALTEDVWGARPPQNPRAALQTTVSRLRARAGADAIVSAPDGYQLGIGTDLDAAEREIVAAEALAADDPARLALLDAALARWRGEPGAGLARAPVAEDLAALAGRLRDRAGALRAGALVAAGRTAEGASAAAALAEARPLDESAVAALMGALAADGRPHEALAVFADFRTRLRDELGASPSAALDARHTEILRGAAPPARSRRGLRAAATPLLGRDDDLAALAVALDAGRLVTILGAGGLGKTRLAQAVAAASAAPAVAVVELAAVRSDADVPLAVAAGLGIPAPTPSRLADGPPAPDVRERTLLRLAERTTLLVLDNCEQIVEGVATWAADALAAVPSLRILATSRAPLGIAGEVVYPLAPLPTDDGAGPAVRLFVDRARALRPDAELPEDVVARLCERLDGLPLAIELAAARVRTMSPAQIEARLADRFALLTTGDRAAPERHRTLQAVIEWSWDLLDADARCALARLAVLPAGFGAETAARVVGRDDADDVLDRLVSQSLVRVGEEGGGGIRFRMLETVREFGLAKLDEDDGADDAWDGAREWARAFALERVGSAFEAAAFRELTVEHDNLVHVLRRAVAERRPADVAPLFAALGQVWVVRGVIDEIGAFAEPVSELLVPTPDAGGRRPPLPLPASGPAADAFVVALILAAAGLGERGVPRVPRMVAALRVVAGRLPLSPRWRAAVAILLALVRDERMPGVLADLSASDDPEEALVGSTALAQLAENEGDLAAAFEPALRAWRIASRHGDSWIAATTALAVGQLASEAGRPAEALEWFARADAASQAFGTDVGWQQTWVRGGNLLAVGRVDEARAVYTGLLTGRDSTSDALGIAGIGAFGLAEVERVVGEPVAAAEMYERAIGMLRTVRGRLSPWYLVSMSALLAATTVDGTLTPHRRAWWAGRVRSRLLATRRMEARTDRPLIGSVLTGWSAWALAEPGMRDVAVEAFALAEAHGARQDLVSLALAPHAARVESHAGAAALAAARAAAAALTPAGRTDRAVALLGRPR